MSCSLLLSVILFLLIHEEPSPGDSPKSYLTIIPWFSIWTGQTSLQFTASMVINEISCLMLIVVNLVSLLVNIYSVEYMHGKRNYVRYFSYLAIFTFSMLGIVISDNLLITFMFWEIVGFSSYLLIGFWFDKDSAVRASKKAFLFNRIGDLGFLLGLFIIYNHFKTFEITSLAHQISLNPQGSSLFFLTMAGFGFVAAAAGKSAQFPLQVWLPDAMEGPTPVSALIHAATMVTAGIYLLTKLFFLLTPDVKTFIACLGSFTVFFGALPALLQTDIKKILAFSTISQLGYMLMGLGFSTYQPSYFHLITHAFFKAGLFLSAGSVIHFMHHIKQELHLQGKYISFDAQDVRLMGGFFKIAPVTTITFVLCSLALIGFPLTSGYLSKELLLHASLDWAENNSANGQVWYFIVPAFAFGGLFITTIYSLRQFYYVFMGDFRLAGKHEEGLAVFYQQKEKSYLIKIPLLILAFLSLFLPFSFYPLDPAASWVFQSLDPADTTFHFEVYPLIVISTGVLFFYLSVVRKLWRIPPSLKNLLYNNWYLDQFYRKLLFLPSRQLAIGAVYTDVKVIDVVIHFLTVFNVVLAHIIFWIDRFVIDGLVRLTVFVSGRLGSYTRSFQNGLVQSYYLKTFVFFLFLVITLYWLAF